jgi:hypothetical protein
MPRSYRFCIECMRERLYIYSEKEGHSICSVCLRPTTSLHPSNKKYIQLVEYSYRKGWDDALKQYLDGVTK